MTETTVDRQLSLEEINDYRRRVLNGETVPPEELALALRALRSHRSTSIKGTKKAKEREMNGKSLDDLLQL